MKLKEVYSIANAINDTADALRGGGDYSLTTIRCTLNDLLDMADKDGMHVNFDYDQPRAVARVRSLLV